jgi:Protein of unknown function (DUF2442)
MYHNIYKIESFRLTGEHSIEIVFNDSSRKTIDLSPLLYGEMYGPLKDPEFFKQATLDKEVHTIIWPNGADFDPSLLYNWEQHLEELSRRAKGWNLQEI